MNKVFLIGRLTRDPELRYTGNNTPVATFSLAVNRNFAGPSGERETDFINIVVWRKQAENVKNYIFQGSQVAIDGRIQTRSYDGEDGKKRYVTEVVADSVQFLDSKSSKNQTFAESNAMDKEITPSDFSNDIKETRNDPFADFGSNIEISDDELPF